MTYEALLNKVKLLGVSFKERHFENVQDIKDLEENIVINCSSFGSEKIFNDHDFFPIKGHMLIFRNTNHPDYIAFENVGEETSIWVTLYPRGDELIICGTLEEGIREETVDPKIVSKMLENTRSRFSRKKQM